MRRLTALSVIGTLVGILFLALLLVLLQPNLTETQNGEETPELVAKNPTESSHVSLPSPNAIQEDGAADGDPILKELDDSGLGGAIETLAVEMVLLDRHEFFLKHNVGLLEWKPYSDAREGFAEQNKDRGEFSVDAALKEGQSLLAEFWEAGDFSNPEGWRPIYKARFLAEQALEQGGREDDRVWKLLEDAIISAIPAEGPYSTQGGANFVQSCSDIKYTGLGEIFKVSTLHFLELISKKTPAQVTSLDMAVANRILRASFDRPLSQMLISHPEIAQMANFDLQKLRELSLEAIEEEFRKARSAARDTLNRRVATWMLDVSRKKGWTVVVDETEAALTALDAGKKRVPFTPILYANNLLFVFPREKEAYLRYERFVDGFTLEYRGQPTHLPRFTNE